MIDIDLQNRDFKILDGVTPTVIPTSFSSTTPTSTTSVPTTVMPTMVMPITDVPTSTMPTTNAPTPSPTMGTMAMGTMGTGGEVVGWAGIGAVIGVPALCFGYYLYKTRGQLLEVGKASQVGDGQEMHALGEISPVPGQGQAVDI